jgi:CIC family chloride channel protein
MSTRDIGRLPVVDRDDSHRLLGVLRRSNVIRAYDTALTRRATLRHRAHQARLGEIGGVDIQEFTILPGAYCEGRQVAQVAWPRDCVVATLRRGRRLLIPRGNTVLQAGDVLAVVAEGEALHTVAALCQTKKETSG